MPIFMNKPKLIDVGFTTVLNEEECIRGWIKQALFFCKEVYILLDPTSTDDTKRIIQEEFPQVHLKYQDRTLGDADRNTPGKVAIWHQNQNEFVKKIPNGSWFMFYDCDERFDPRYYAQMYECIQQAQKANSEGLYTTVKYEHIMSEDYVVDFNATINQMIFWKKTKYTERQTDAHGGWLVPHTAIPMTFPFYHYSRIKENKKPFVWYDEIESSDYFQMQKRFGHINYSRINCTFRNWRDLKGEEY